MIEVLLEKGYAYVAGGNVYFDTSKLDDYYVFSSQSEKELLVGVRDDVEEDVNKKNKMCIRDRSYWMQEEDCSRKMGRHS